MAKLITLDQFKMLANKVHEEDNALGVRIDNVVSQVEGLVTAGGEPNVLNGVKVNGNALAITDKMVDLVIETGSENGTINVAGAAVAIKGLASLAYKSEISEDELSEALKASIAAKATEADLNALEVRVETAEGAIKALQDAGYQTEAQVQTIVNAAIAASGHAHFETTETDPTSKGFEAQENVMYLYMNATTNHYDIYAKVGDEVVLLDDTTVDLSTYSTTEQMNAAIQAAIEGLSIGDYAKADDLNAAVERISALEAKFANYYTKEEAEAKFTDETEAQTIAEATVAAATASDGEASAAIDEVFTPAE